MLADLFWARGPSAPFTSIASLRLHRASSVYCGRPRRAHCIETTSRNSFDPQVNGRGTLVNGVAYGGKASYSCILGAFGTIGGTTRPAPGILRTPRGGRANIGYMYGV